MNTSTPLALLTALALTAALGCNESRLPETATTETSATDGSDSHVPADEALGTDADDSPGLGGDAATPTPAALDFELPSLAGQPTHLAQYHGQVVLIVNTASQCGLTPQYEQLQQLHETYADQGLAVLGFPANNFGAQEPGTDEEIATFCEENFGVGFDMFAKLSVKGDDQHPLYAYLTGEDTNPDFAGDIAWNFEKFLLNREGQVVARFDPRTRPDAPEVVSAIEAELARN
ncbi:glutathione peroxidase [Phycisphaeraceae bacterium D3-23]